MFGLGKSIKVGLALGGGGAKGFAHIGVLRTLEANNIPIQIITGTSAGSIAGGMYAQLGSIEAVEEKMLGLLNGEFIKKNKLDIMVPPKEWERQKLLKRISYFVKQQFILSRTFVRMSFFGADVLEEALSYLLDDTDIRETKIPFGAATVDYLSGKRVLLTEGPIRKAVAASCTIPGVFPPVAWDDMKLVDGGVTSLIPVIEAQEMGATFIIGVNVSPGIEEDLDIRNALELMFRADEITSHYLTMEQLKHADVIIHPDLGRIHWADFKNADAMIRIGIETAEQNIDALRNALKKKKFHHWFV